MSFGMGGSLRAALHKADDRRLIQLLGLLFRETVNFSVSMEEKSFR